MKTKLEKSLIFKRICFYIISLTWGAIMSIPGLVLIAISAIFGRVHVYHGRLYAVLGKNWGGFNLGCFFIIGEGNEGSAPHECGHGLQNCIWGPLMPFIISIPSAIRYWYRVILEKVNYEKYKQLPSYYSIWFEGQASEWGKTYIETDLL